MKLNFQCASHRLLFFVLAMCSAFSVHAAPLPEAIDQVAERAMEKFQVPGLALSVVQGGNIQHAAGYGFAETGRDSPVTPQTLFQIASVSKAFTAAALALLVDEGSASWDAPVIDFLPEFRMYDPWVTREFTIRDLLTHRSGLPIGAGDLLLFPEAKTTASEVVHAMRYLKPSSSFRSEYAYDNLLYIVAGEVVARVAGVPFTEFLENRLLHPLGMNDCTGSFDRLPAGAPRATPHLLVDGEWEVTRSGITETSAAAGGINCSAASMARWMQFVLDGGKTAAGEALISETQFRQWVKPVTLTEPRPYMTEHAGAQLSAYALGWGVTTFHGERMLAHGGGLWGMTTFVAILPAIDLAVFVSNNQMSAAPRAVALDVLELFLAESSNVELTDWSNLFSDLLTQRRSDAETEVATREDGRDADSKPSLPLAQYAGSYRDNWYGDIEISLNESGQLWFRSGRSERLSGPLEHFQFDTFIARWSDRQLNADAFVSFSLDPDGRVDRIRMKAVSPLTDFSYDFHDLDLRRVSD